MSETTMQEWRKTRMIFKRFFIIFTDGYDSSIVEVAAVRLESLFLAMIYGSERLNRCSRVLQSPKHSNPCIRSVHLNQTKMMNGD